MKKIPNGPKTIVLILCLGGPCGISFSKEVAQSSKYSIDSKVGEIIGLEVSPIHVWPVKVFNKMDERSLEAPPVLFLESDNQELFSYLCDHTVEETGWSCID